MTRRAVLVLESHRVQVVRDATARSMREVPWNPDAPADIVEAVRDVLTQSGGVPRELTLIVGLGFLEPARHDLPPVPAPVRHRMLRVDRDRFFVCEGDVATALDGDWACATDATRLRRWWDAFERIAPIHAVLALPSAARMAGLVGTWQTEAGRDEAGSIVVNGRGLAEIRRSRTMSTHPTSTGDRRTPRTADALPAPLDVAALARIIAGRSDIPAADQLLDTTLGLRLERRERRRIGRSALLTTAALLALGWAVNHRQTRTLIALEAEHARLEAAVAPPRAAQQRLFRAIDERRILDASALAAHAADAPMAVLARLGTLIPEDAFVQRLEWDGTRWRIDGSAINASRLVPLLDADSVIDDVQSLAPSIRFLDAGRARSSFAIGFRVAGDATGNVSGSAAP